MWAQFTPTVIFLFVGGAAAGSPIGTAPIGTAPIGGAPASANVIRQLEKILPPLEAAKVAAIDKKLKTISDDQLLLLEVVPDLCNSNLFDCEGLPTPLVKPVVSIALEQRRSAASKADALQTRWISLGSFAVSVVSLALSIAAFITKRETS